MAIAPAAAYVDVSTAPPSSAVSWPAIFAGGLASAALTLVLLSFGAGMGFAVTSPWAGSGVSATTFGVGAGIYFIVVAAMASAVGGYLAGRLRTRWTGATTDEVFFRDTAHGLLAWAFATVISAGLLASAATHVLAAGANGATQAAAIGASQVAGQSRMSGPMQTITDTLLRSDPAVPRNPDQMTATRGELSRLLVPAFNRDGSLQPADRTYAAQIVAARTGITQAEAERRIDDAIVQAKSAADAARKAGIALSLWFAASLLVGAFAASLAAIEGGGLRDGTWKRS